MVELEPVARGAPSPLLVDVAASASVPLVNGAPHRGRDVARGGRGVDSPRALPRGLRPARSAGFEPLELLGDGLLDDRGQVAVGHRGAHEGLEPLELVVELGGGRELDPVASRGRGARCSRAAARGRSGSPRSVGRRRPARPVARTRPDAVRARRRPRRTGCVLEAGGATRSRPSPRRAPGSVRVASESRPARCRSGGRAASASPPGHPAGARAPRPAPRSRASSGGRPAPGASPGSPGSGAGASFAMAVRCSRPLGAAWSAAPGALARRGPRRCGGRPRPRRGGEPRCSRRTSRVRPRGRRAGARPPRQCARRGRPRRAATAEKIRETTEQLVVGNDAQRVRVFHADNIGRVSRPPGIARARAAAADARSKPRTANARLVARARPHTRPFRAAQRRLARAAPPKLVKGKVRSGPGTWVAD